MPGKRRTKGKLLSRFITVFRTIAIKESNTEFSGIQLLRNDPLLRGLSKLSSVSIFTIFAVVYGIVLLDSVRNQYFYLPSPNELGFIEDIPAHLMSLLLYPLALIFLIRFFRMIPETYNNLLKEDVLNLSKKSLSSEFSKYRWYFESMVIFHFSLIFVIITGIIGLSNNATIFLKNNVQSWFFFNGKYTITNNFIAAFIIVLNVTLFITIAKLIVFIIFNYRVIRINDGKKSKGGRSKDIVNIRVLHPDSAGGLKRIGDLCMALNLFIFSVGMIVSLFVLKKAMITGEDVALSFNVFLQIGIYIVLAPLLFFLPMWSFHRKMKEAKNEMLEELSIKFNSTYKKIMKTVNQKNKGIGKEDVEELERIQKMYDIGKSMPIWPFNVKNISLFIGTVVLPVGSSLAAGHIASFFKSIF